MRHVITSIVVAVSLSAPGYSQDVVLAPDASQGDLFGFSLAARDDTLLVGAIKKQEFITQNGQRSLRGLAYLYDDMRASDAPRILLSPPAGTNITNVFFGFATALTNNVALVTDPKPVARGCAVACPLPQRGLVYPYNLDTGSRIAAWPAPINSHPGDEFGFSLDVDGNVAVVGAPDYGSANGAAYLIDTNTGASLTSAPLTAFDARAGMDFGFSVSISEDYVVVGARGNRERGELMPGAIYVFDRNTSMETARKYTAGVYSEPGDEFGFSVDVQGDIAVVGAPRSPEQAGTAFVLDLKTGDILHRLVPSERHDYDDFGLSVRVHGNTAVVGAPGDRIFRNPRGDEPVAGAVYMFDFDTGIQLDSVTAAAPATSTLDDEFGTALAVGAGTLAVGAPLSDLASPSRENFDGGAVYVFDFETSDLPGDVCVDLRLDACDIDILTSRILSGIYNPAFDLNVDLVLDQADRLFLIEELLGTTLGDANLDGSVNDEDLALVNMQLFSHGTGWAGGDFNGDGSTDGQDFNIYLNHRGPLSVANTETLPEPSTALLFGLGLMAYFARARRSHAGSVSKIP